MDRCVVTYSALNTKEAVLEENIRQLEEKTSGIQPKVIFLSSDYENFSWYSSQIAARYPKASVIGMSSYVVFSSEGFSAKGLTLMALNSGIECATGVLLEVTRYPMRYAAQIEQALSQLSDLKNCCCIEVTTAFGNGEELVLDTFKSVLLEKEIPVFGGSAGSTEGTRKTLVSLNGTVYEEACVFVLLHNLNGRILLYCENMFQPTEHFFTATSVNCEERAVYEYDRRPAAAALSDALNVPMEELSEQLLTHPMGRMLGDDIYITDSEKINEDGMITYYTRIYNHTKMVLMEPDDMEQVWERTAQKVRNDTTAISFSFIVNCLSRSKYFEQEHKFYDFAKKLKQEYGPYLGVSGFGEQMNFEHLNQTMVLAIFE